MEEIKTVEVQDPIYEETYTAHIQKNGTSWIGWIPEVPEVECEEHTREALLKTLVKDLHEALEAEQEAWEKQFEADVKAGHLDYLREEALEDLRAGRCCDWNRLDSTSQQRLSGIGNRRKWNTRLGMDRQTRRVHAADPISRTDRH